MMMMIDDDDDDDDDFDLIWFAFFLAPIEMIRNEDVDQRALSQSRGESAQKEPVTMTRRTVVMSPTTVGVICQKKCEYIYIVL